MSLAATDMLALYRRRNRRRAALVVLLAALAFLALLADLVTGPAGLPLSDTLAALVGRGEVPQMTSIIVREVRLPVAVVALLVGAALGLAGAEMQTVLENPLAEPFTLGVSASAALGAALAIVLVVGLPFLAPKWAVPANAFVFATGSLALLGLLARIRGGGPETLILFGIALSFTASALLSAVQFVASADSLQQLVFWTMGSLARADWDAAGMMALVLALAVPFALRDAWRMTALRLGAERASSFGVDVRRLRRAALVRVSLLAATAVSIVGIVGFVGLAGPHIARMLVGEDHRFYLPTSLFTGALVMSLASTVSKTAVPGAILPIGIVTALIGLPVFFWLILRQGRKA